MKNKQEISKPLKKHSPLITGLMSFFAPGWGLCIIGRYSEGLYHFIVFAVCLFFLLPFSIWFAATINHFLVFPFVIVNMLFWLTPTLLFMIYTAFYTAFRTKEHNHRLEYEKYIDKRKLLREVMWGDKRIHKKEE